MVHEFVTVEKFGPVSPSILHRAGHQGRGGPTTMNECYGFCDLVRTITINSNNELAFWDPYLHQVDSSCSVQINRGFYRASAEVPYCANRYNKIYFWVG